MPIGVRLDTLSLFSIGVVTVISIPIYFIIYSAFNVDFELWQRLYSTRLTTILPNTIKLLISVGFLTTIIGTSTAWIISRYDFPGKKIWEWALLLPLAVPGYVLAYAYASIFAPGGFIQSIWLKIFGDINMFPNLYSFWGVSIVLSLVNYPYVYLLARASLISQNLSYDEAARVLGVPRWRRILFVNINMAYPGILAGVSLVLMEVMADFGTVAMLRYPTFTEAIYRQMTARFDPSGAAALSFVLVLITFCLLIVERYFRKRSSFEQTRGKFRRHILRQIDWFNSSIFNLYIVIILFLAFFAPVSLLLIWSIEVILNGAIDIRFIKFTFNTILVSSIAATLAVILAFPVSYLHARKPNFLNKLLFYLSTLGYSLPGPVIAVGFLLTAGKFFPWLYGGFILLISSYIVRFIPITIYSHDSLLSTISKNLEDASKTLGSGVFLTIKRILLPLLMPGIITGWVMVFVDCMKELPATLMLRPLAFDTLSVRIWMDASEALWKMAAPPSLIIVLTGFIPVALLIGKLGKR